MTRAERPAETGGSRASFKIQCRFLNEEVPATRACRRTAGRHGRERLVGFGCQLLPD